MNDFLQKRFDIGDVIYEDNIDAIKKSFDESNSYYNYMKSIYNANDYSDVIEQNRIYYNRKCGNDNKISVEYIRFVKAYFKDGKFILEVITYFPSVGDSA